MATQTGSYLYYSDAPAGVVISSATMAGGAEDLSWIYSLDALNGKSSNVQDLNNVLTLELNFWVLGGETDWEYYDSTKDVGLISYGTYSQLSETYAPYYIADPNVSGGTEMSWLYAYLSEEISSSHLTIDWAGDSYPEYGYFYAYSESSGGFFYNWDDEKLSKPVTGGNLILFDVSPFADFLPGRMFKINSIVLGNEITLTGSAMRSAKIVNEMSLNSETLPASTLTFTFEAEDGTVPFEYGGGIQAYGKTLSGDVKLIGTYYIDTITRKTTTQFTIEAVDAIGVLAGVGWTFSSYTLYSLGFNNSASTNIMDFFSISNKFNIEILNDISTRAAIAVVFTDETGLSLRDWLQQALFALATRCRTDGSNAIQLFALEESEDGAAVIDDSRVYQGITLDEVEATESAGLYFHVVNTDKASAAAKSVQKTIYGTTVYDNMYYGQYNGTTLWYSSTDSAEMVVEDCYFLSNVGNSSTIASYAKSLLYDFHQRTKTADLKIVWDGEHLGDLVTVPDPYGYTLTGHIQKMTFTLSNITAVEIEVLGLAGQ